MCYLVCLSVCCCGTPCVVSPRGGKSSNVCEVFPHMGRLAIYAKTTHTWEHFPPLEVHPYIGRSLPIEGGHQGVLPAKIVSCVGRGHDCSCHPLQRASPPNNICLSAMTVLQVRARARTSCIQLSRHPRIGRTASNGPS